VTALQPPGSKPPASLGFEESARRIAEHARYIAGGVNSNFRFGMASGPLVFERGDGAHLIDVDGNRLIDYYCGMGAALLGHTPATVIAAVKDEVERGILFAGQVPVECEAARLICERVPSAQRLRFTSSGSEAVHAAIRLARAATGRRIVIKFEGHYHGWLDSILWSTAPGLNAAGPDDAPIPVAGSKGQDLATAEGLVVLGWNDLAALEARLAQGDVAAVLMEPVMCNQGAIAPLPGYLEGALAACRKHGAVLIFDEVVTGFRLGSGGAQKLFGVTPDLTILAKAIASGFPVAAVAGRADLLDQLADGVLHGGTFNAQPAAMAALVATQRALTPELYERSFARGQRLQDGIRTILGEAGITAQVVGPPLIFHVSFGLDAPARNYRDIARADKPAYVRFAFSMLKRGVRILERGAWFVSSEHDDAVIDATLDAVRGAAGEI